MGRNFIKTRKYDKILTRDGDDNIDTAKRERRHAPRPEAGRDRGTGMGQAGGRHIFRGVKERRSGVQRHFRGLGRWQTKKVYVDEVNRILRLKRKQKRYRYDDRTNPVKAREMFEIYQSHHNPKKDIDRAIRLHRGLHSAKYVKEVKRKLRK